MKEKFFPTPKSAEARHAPEIFLDESLYELQVEELREAGEKRGRKGVLADFGRFLKTPAGKTVAAAYLSVSAFANAHIAHEYLTRGPRDIYEIENAPPSPDSFAGDRPLEEARSELTLWLGEETVRDLVPVTASDRDRSARERRREEIRNEAVADVEGFDAVGISNDSVVRYLEEGFPRFMTAEGNLSTIEFTTEHRPMREDYHLGTGAETAGSCSVAEADEASVIRLYGALLDSDGRLGIEETFRDVLTHELAHAIDWENLEAVDPATRTRMLHQMVSHVRDDEHRLRFSYVERIASDDPQEQLRNRAVEYYAEFTANVFQFAPIISAEDPFWARDTTDSLISAYGNTDLADFDDYERYRRSVQDDVELIREVVRAYDPDFDWVTAARARRESISRLRTERAIHELTEATEDMLESARELVRERIDHPMETEVSRDSFLRRAGSASPESHNMYESDMISRETYIVGRGLEQEIISAQNEAIRRLEREVSPGDMPAYRALTAIIETLSEMQPAYASAMEMNGILGLMEDYRSAARHASPAHVETARHHLEVLQGVRDLPPELNTRINRFLSAID